MKPRDANKIDLIFKATLRLVNDKGLAGTTINSIAHLAGLATGTVYTYFKNKETLVNELYRVCRKASAAVYFKNYDPELPFKEGFKIIWFNLFEYRMNHFKEMIFLDQCYHSPFITESTKRMTRKLFSPLFTLMETGRKKGLLKNNDPFLLLSCIVGSINEIVKYAYYNKKKLSKATIESLFEMCWDGIRE